MAYSVDLREKAVFMVEKGKPKEEVVELLKIATLLQIRKKADGKMPKTNSGFIRNFAENRFAKMKQNLRF